MATCPLCGALPDDECPALPAITVCPRRRDCDCADPLPCVHPAPPGGTQCDNCAGWLTVERADSSAAAAWARAMAPDAPKGPPTGSEGNGAPAPDATDSGAPLAVAERAQTPGAEQGPPGAATPDWARQRNDEAYARRFES